jgi:hypothetical protein
MTSSNQDPGFENRWEETGNLPFDSAVVVGKDPFRRGKMLSYLWNLGAETKYLGDLEAPDVLVVGRSWVEENEKPQTKNLLNQRRGERLRICSQEMLLAWSMTDVDPNRRPQTVQTFIEGHPILESIAEFLGGKWPGTEPLPSFGSEEETSFGPDESPISRLGYKTGQNGVSASKRRSILRTVYELDLSSFPSGFSKDYLNEWGDARSGVRLERIAIQLAAPCRSFRKKKGDYSLAISQREDDLAWLKEEYFNPLDYGFSWPSTEESGQPSSSDSDSPDLLF